MSIEEDLERRLDNWARWYWGGAIGSQRVSSIYGIAARSNRWSDAPLPIINGEAIETDTAYRTLAIDLQVVLRARYLRLVADGLSGELYPVRTLSEIQVAAALYISYDTYLRRLHRARGALRDHLLAVRGARRRTAGIKDTDFLQD